MMADLTIHFGDNLPVLEAMPAAAVDLIYIDPPFNTGKVQSRTRLSTVRDDDGDRTGFQGKRYRTVKLGTQGYVDWFDDYLAFLEPRLIEARRVLEPDGSLFFHIDYREVHYCKVLLDMMFGRESFLNEIIWAYDYGARSKTKWPAKHDNILWYAKDPENYCFQLERVRPDSLHGARAWWVRRRLPAGKTPTDTWWHTIVSPNGKEKTGYPTQKPRGILDRIVKVHSRPGDVLLDFFAGSGTFGESAGHARAALRAGGRQPASDEGDGGAFRRSGRRVARLATGRGYRFRRRTGVRLRKAIFRY